MIDVHWSKSCFLVFIKLNLIIIFTKNTFCSCTQTLLSLFFLRKNKRLLKNVAAWRGLLKYYCNNIGEYNQVHILKLNRDARFFKRRNKDANFLLSKSLCRQKYVYKTSSVVFCNFHEFSFMWNSILLQIILDVLVLGVFML